MSHAEPRANPHVLPRALRWLGKRRRPFCCSGCAGIRRSFSGSCAFCANAFPDGRIQYAPHRGDGALQPPATALLRQETGIDYDQLTRGILHFYTDAKEFDTATAAAAVMRRFGRDRQTLSVAECIAIEPSLAGAWFAGRWRLHRRRIR